MLNPSCERFRTHFEPHGERTAELDVHRCSCAACATWAERLETFIRGAEPRPMPDRLRQRLSAVPSLREAVRPGADVSCHDVDRLYEATWRRARHGEGDGAVAGHLETCRRCRRLYATLDASFREPRHPLSRALVRGLRAIVERRRMPLFVRDGRLAMAASAVLTAGLLLLLGNPTAFFRSTTETLSSQATVLAEAGEERGQALWESLSDELETRYERGREILVEHGQSYRELWDDARGFYQNEKWRQLFESLTLEGESDGEP